MDKKVTRGNGLLEKFLAKRRSDVANGLIPFSHRKGRILDIGCGSYPFFLVNTEYSEKYGIDRIGKEALNNENTAGINLLNFDIEKSEPMPFPDNYFSAVTALAVVEHIAPSVFLGLLKEIKRVLIPGGVYVMTTPAPWSGGLLDLMVKLRLVSSDEIEEHKAEWGRNNLLRAVTKNGFVKENVRFGYFEIFMNTWMAVIK